MQNINMLNQKDADYYINLEKHSMTDIIYDLSNYKLQIPLVGQSPLKEDFLLDITRHIIRLEKYTIQNRVRKSLCLVRVDLGTNGIHTNPDGKKIIGSHIHIYREGYDLKWAHLLPFIGAHGHRPFADLNSLFSNLDQFYNLCNVKVPPKVQGGLL